MKTQKRYNSAPSLGWFRRKRDLTQAELALLVGFHHSTVRQIEVGLKPASLSAMKAFAGALDCTVDDLLRSPEADPPRATTVSAKPSSCSCDEHSTAHSGL